MAKKQAEATANRGNPTDKAAVCAAILELLDPLEPQECNDVVRAIAILYDCD